MSRKTTPDANTLPMEPARAKIAKAMRGLVAGGDPGPITLRLKPTKRAKKTYPLKLTKEQRESMIHCARIKHHLRERLLEVGEGPQVIGVNRKQLEYLNDELGRAALDAFGPDKKRLVAVLHHVADLLPEPRTDLLSDEKAEVRKTAPTKGKVIYQFKVTLLHIEPAIWRRVKVPNCTLAELHEYIQAAFGWWNDHLHEFEIFGERYGPLAPDDMAFNLEMEDETKVRLSKLIPKSGRRQRWIYEYDFGDGWRHEILFEGFPPDDAKAKYPQCVGGERACPPEDCGGPWGYGAYLAAIGDPRNEQHEEMLEWHGPFDPEAFDATKATREMRKVK